MIIYRVKAGDTLASIAREHGVLPTVLSCANALCEGEPLIPGQALVIAIPAATYHVREGDTVASVARGHGMRAHRLRQLNPSLGGRDALYPGMTLCLSPASPPRSALTVLGYTTAATPPSDLSPALPYLTMLAVEGTALTTGMPPALPKAEAIVAAARSSGVVPLLVLNAVGRDGAQGESERTRTLLENEAEQKRLIAELAPRLAEGGYGGVFLDFPFVPREMKNAYLSFVMLLRHRLGHSNSVIASVAAPTGSTDGLFSLGRAVGGLSLETYDFATRYGEPAPPAPYDKIRTAALAARSAVRPQKILLGLSTRAQDRGVNARCGSILPAKDALRSANGEAAVYYDPVAKSPYLSYHAEDGRHILFFEDAESFAERLALVDELGLGGITLYPSVALPTPLLTLLGNSYRIVKAHES